MSKKSRKMRRKARKGRTFYLYICEDGEQYCPNGVNLFEYIEDLPDDVDEFWFVIKPLMIMHSRNSENALMESLFESRLQAEMNPDKESFLNQAEWQRANLFREQEMIQALVEWNYEDEQGNAIDITQNAIDQLSPAWIHNHMKTAFDIINGVSKNLRSV